MNTILRLETDPFCPLRVGVRTTAHPSAARKRDPPDL